MALEDTDIMEFGRHQGKRLIDVPASYLLFIYDNFKLKPDLKDYIEDNKQGLEQEKAKRDSKFKRD